MKSVACPVCGVKVRRNQLAAHRAAAHRGRKRKKWKALALATSAIGFVVISASALIYLAWKTDEGGTEVEPYVDHNATAVTFQTEDGWTIKGAFYRGDLSQPLLILVHGIGEDRRSFDTLVTDLRAKGYNVLAYDSRGMGQSTLQDGRYRDWKTFTEQDFKAMVNDIYSAKYYALSNFMSAPKVGIIGGSIGANEALTFACQTGASDNKALVLLSPGVNYRGIQSAPAVAALNLQGTQPRIFFCAAQDDEAGAAAVALRLNDSYTGPKQLEMMSGPRHGTQMLTDPAFRTKVVDFLADAFSG